MNPKCLYFGKDIHKIKFTTNSVEKFFKKRDAFQKSLYFLRLLKGNNHFPNVYSYDPVEKSITMSNCGNLLSLDTLPKDWRKQFATIRSSLKHNKLCILDIRVLPYTPYVVNNMCVKNGNISVVDVVLFRPRSDFYIDYKIGFLEYQLLLFSKINTIGGQWVLPVLFLLHILFECLRMFLDFLEILIMRDVFVF